MRIQTRLGRISRGAFEYTSSFYSLHSQVAYNINLFLTVHFLGPCRWLYVWPTVGASQTKKPSHSTVRRLLYGSSHIIPNIVHIQSMQVSIARDGSFCFDGGQNKTVDDNRLRFEAIVNHRIMAIRSLLPYTTAEPRRVICASPAYVTSALILHPWYTALSARRVIRSLKWGRIRPALYRYLMTSLDRSTQQTHTSTKYI